MKKQRLIVLLASIAIVLPWVNLGGPSTKPLVGAFQSWQYAHLNYMAGDNPDVYYSINGKWVHTYEVGWWQRQQDWKAYKAQHPNPELQDAHARFTWGILLSQAHVNDQGRIY